MKTEPDPILPLFLPVRFLFLLINNWDVAFALAFIVLLLALSALASSSEVAFFSLSYNDLRDFETENTPSGRRILRLVNAPRKLLATILIANNFINIGIVVLSDYLLRLLLPDTAYTGVAYFLERIFPFLSFSPGSLEHVLSFTVNVVGVSFLIVLFAEVAPKMYAQANKIALVRFMTAPLAALAVAFTPLSYILVNGVKYMERRLASSGGGGEMTGKDLDKAIDLTVVNDDEGSGKEVDLLKRIVKFGDVAVKQIMCPRTDVVAVDFRTAFKKLLQIVKDSGFSRLPVYDEDFDNITGILYVKDLIPYFNENEDFEWQSLIRASVIYAPESKKIADLLREFQKERLHMAIVVNEYGGSAGIVTLEDVMEEVIGEIRDEFDDEMEVDYKKIDDRHYIFEGKTLLNDVCRVLKIDTETFANAKGDASSLAGLMLEITGDFPKQDAEVSHDGYVFKAIKVNKRRVEKVQVATPL